MQELDATTKLSELKNTASDILNYMNIIKNGFFQFHTQLKLCHITQHYAKSLLNSISFRVLSHICHNLLLQLNRVLHMKTIYILKQVPQSQWFLSCHSFHSILKSLMVPFLCRIFPRPVPRNFFSTLKKDGEVPGHHAVP